MRSLLLLLAIPALALGQDTELLNARGLRCSFTAYVSVNWRGDRPEIRPSENLLSTDIVHIDQIDYGAGTATLIHNSGSSDLSIIAGTDTVSFIELLSDREVVVRTVYNSRDESGRFKIASARHLMLFAPAPSQAFGHCEVWH